ncbi:MAG: DUF362 domain-containing protein [Acidobacteria bacterium]|nr:DUF362 domain-containing protein [Acidobacteriota bacterium]
MSVEKPESVERGEWSRRDFVRAAGAAGASLAVLGVPSLAAETPPAKPAPTETNLADFMKVKKGPHAIPGPFPGKVVSVVDPASLEGDAVNGKVVDAMVRTGVRTLTGKDDKESFKLLFDKTDIVGIKVNPVGAPLINTRPEVVEALVRWLRENGLPGKNIVIWDRFEAMLTEAGFTAKRFPDVGLEALQVMDETGSSWRDAEGNHRSAGNFDREVFYFAKGIEGKGVRGYKDDEFYLNQHVFNGEHSYFGKLLTKKLTKIINVAAYKNTGNGISMATKNLGYGAVCNTGRLHAPLFFRVCTEVLAAPPVRDKLVLNVTDGLRGQYEDGPMMNEKYVYPHHTLYFATDPFALDMVCHREMVDKRKSMGIAVNENPRFTDYLHEAQRLGLGIADPAKIERIEKKS